MYFSESTLLPTRRGSDWVYPKLGRLRGWKRSLKGKKTTRFSGTQPEKELDRAGWLKRLGLLRATQLADFAVITSQL